MWGLAGYQANATSIARIFHREVGKLFAYGDPPDSDRLAAAAPYRIAEAAGVVLQRDIDTVARLGATAVSELPRLGRALTAALYAGRAEQADLAVLAAYGLVGRSARSLATGPDTIVHPRRAPAEPAARAHHGQSAPAPGQGRGW
ncbi:hypothetical protein [Streptomyces globisporus]